MISKFRSHISQLIVWTMALILGLAALPGSAAPKSAFPHGKAADKNAISVEKVALVKK